MAQWHIFRAANTKITTVAEDASAYSDATSLLGDGTDSQWQQCPTWFMMR